MISLRGIRKTFLDGRKELHVLEEINLSIEKGEFTSIIGPSRSGKSTLLNVLGLLDKPTSGEYLFAGESVVRISAGRLAICAIGASVLCFNRFAHATDECA